MNPETPTNPPPGDANPPARFNWLLFLTAMLAPAALTSLVVLLGGKTGDAGPVTGFLGSIAAGIICGIMLGLRFGKTVGIKILLSVIFIHVISIACLAMSTAGCLASGYNLNFH